MRRVYVHELMTSPVITVTPATPFKEIAALLADSAISAVPVVDVSGRPVGVVSEADLLLKGRHDGRLPGSVLARAWSGSRPWRRQAPTAATLMTSEVLSVGAHEAVSAAGRLLADGGHRRVFVVDGNGRLTGVLSRRDLLRIYLRSDTSILDEVARVVFRDGLPIDPGSVDIRVSDGVVRLSGIVPRPSQVQLAGTLTEEVPGVVSVRNSLQAARSGGSVSHGENRRRDRGRP